MPYILNKTNGTKFLTVDDSSIDMTTNLTFVGKNYAGYGEIVNENFLKLLENFSNSVEPDKPILGQLWFDNSTKRLSIYDGDGFKGISHVRYKPTMPSYPVEGELWWDTTAKQLKIFNGVDFKLIGPLSASSRSSWEFSEEVSQTDSTQTSVPVIKGKIAGNVIATLARNEIVPRALSDLVITGNATESFNIVKKGITLVGSDSVTGSSRSSNTYFWGTAADALYATTTTNVISTQNNSVNQNYSVVFVSTTATNRDSNVFVSSGISFNPSSNTLSTTLFNGVATSARYADLAERYESDGTYDVGTVVVIGGTKEITLTHTHADTAVIGVISEKPAYLMNSEAGPNDTHPCVALRGRVPCKVLGPIKKGDLLVTSATPGYAEIMKSSDKSAALLGKALQDFNGAKGLIEIVI